MSYNINPITGVTEWEIYLNSLDIGILTARGAEEAFFDFISDMVVDSGRYEKHIPGTSQNIELIKSYLKENSQDLLAKIYEEYGLKAPQSDVAFFLIAVTGNEKYLSKLIVQYSTASSFSYEDIESQTQDFESATHQLVDEAIDISNQRGIPADYALTKRKTVDFSGIRQSEGKITTWLIRKYFIETKNPSVILAHVKSKLDRPELFDISFSKDLLNFKIRKNITLEAPNG